MGQGFKRFLLRGNVVDLAIAVVVGAAFGDVVKAFVQDLVTPLIAAIGHRPDFSTYAFTVNGARFLYGDFVNAVLSFVLLAAVVFFLVVTPVNALISRAHREPPADPTSKACPECLSQIPIDARRCAFCTSPQV